MIVQKNDEIRFNINTLQPLEPRIPFLIKKITWILRPEKQVDEFLDQLRNIIDSNVGNTTVQIGFLMEDNQVLLAQTAKSLTWEVNLHTYKKMRTHPAVADVRISCHQVPNTALHSNSN